MKLRYLMTLGFAALSTFSLSIPVPVFAEGTPAGKADLSQDPVDTVATKSESTPDAVDIPATKSESTPDAVDIPATQSKSTSDAVDISATQSKSTPDAVDIPATQSKSSKSTPDAVDTPPTDTGPTSEAAESPPTDTGSALHTVAPPTTPAASKKRDTRVPFFYDVKPQWGLQFNYSPNALGGMAVTYEQGTLASSAFSLAGEFQPRFLQFFGVIGVGTSATVYPIFGGNNLTRNFAALWSVGVQIRYQAKYFRQQILVPNIAYTYDYFSYAFSAGQNGNLRAQGPVYGLWLLLNKLDPSAAANFYIDAGVARTYLTFEAQNLVGNDGVISFGGLTYYVGLRTEI